MVHLNSFKAVKYRGINGLDLPQLSKANLITGLNGVGKTALIEAMWLFTERFNPRLLWNANVQRTLNPPADPISRLTVGLLELCGSENGTSHKVRCIFEGIDNTSMNGRFSNAIPEGSGRLPPVIGFIRTYLDGNLVKDGQESIHVAPSGVVLYQSPGASVGRASCVMEGTIVQHETPAAEYLK